MLDKPKKKRIPGISFNKIVPNLMTLAALCFGSSAILFAIDGRLQFAVGAIVLSTIFDALDGRTARLLKSTSEFGAQLDSLADLVSFGVAPAITIYLNFLQEAGRLGWMAALLLIVCCCMRLARFNVLLGKLPPYAYNYFQGIAAPIAALLVLLPLTLEFAYGLSSAAYPHWVLLWTIIIALSMLSTVATFSFKKITVSRHWALPLLAAMAILLALFFASPWKVISGLSIVYVLSIPLSAYTYHNLRRKAKRLRDPYDNKEKEDNKHA